MRILVLSKRQYTGRDLLDDQYGRLFEIPEQLIRLGHQVGGLTMSYRQRPAGIYQNGLVTWQSFNGLPLGWGMRKHIQYIRQAIESFRPDIVWASSDMWHGIACAHACMASATPFVIDHYDNYASFTLSRIPGISPLFKRACRKAAGITSVSGRLSDHLRDHYAIAPEKILTLGNATNAHHFQPVARDMARSALGLPKDRILIGSAGSLGASRGTEVVLKALPLLREQLPNLEVVLAGPKDSSLELSGQAGVRYLGILPPSEVPNFYNALDISLICNRPSAFGNYCYPQKLHEILACTTRLLAADVGEMSNLLAQHPAHRFIADNPQNLANQALSLLRQAPTPALPPVYWEQRARELSDFLQQCLRR